MSKALEGGGVPACAQTKGAGSGNARIGLWRHCRTQAAAWLWLLCLVWLVVGWSPATAQTNLAPTVSLTSPEAGAGFNFRSSITLTADAADADGSIASVRFYRGTTLIGTDTTAPYSFTWTNAAAGSYNLTARA
ncbi:MAG: Ig-like domain-containing protein, partial [Hydrogenophaga sp.]